jgi:hypothetical protein
MGQCGLSFIDRALLPAQVLALNPTNPDLRSRCCSLLVSTQLWVHATHVDHWGGPPWAWRQSPQSGTRRQPGVHPRLKEGRCFSCALGCCSRANVSIKWLRSSNASRPITGMHNSRSGFSRQWLLAHQCRRKQSSGRCGPGLQLQGRYYIVPSAAISTFQVAPQSYRNASQPRTRAVLPAEELCEGGVRFCTGGAHAIAMAATIDHVCNSQQPRGLVWAL